MTNAFERRRKNVGKFPLRARHFMKKEKNNKIFSSNLILKCKTRVKFGFYKPTAFQIWVKFGVLNIFNSIYLKKPKKKQVNY